MNPCPCGYFGDSARECRCSQTQIQAYRNKISGPLLDRIDIHIEVPSIRYQDLASIQKGEPSSAMRARVVAAREVQRRRFQRTPHLHNNAGMGTRQIHAHCALGADAQELLKTAITELNFSARAYDRILKVARTIADLAGAAAIQTEHVSEAIQYRSLDRNLWE
jgi:magnesium chelatase family protein